MTINEILTKAINNPENFNENGFLNWSFVDTDLWMHPESVNFTDEELIEGLANFSNRTLSLEKEIK
ncbi:hypothetical protein CL614_09690 [archaeon]|nr:hypothetical protein [archaeon]